MTSCRALSSGNWWRDKEQKCHSTSNMDQFDYFRLKSCIRKESFPSFFKLKLLTHYFAWCNIQWWQTSAVITAFSSLLKLVTEVPYTIMLILKCSVNYSFFLSGKWFLLLWQANISASASYSGCENNSLKFLKCLQWCKILCFQFYFLLFAFCFPSWDSGLKVQLLLLIRTIFCFESIAAF